MDLADTNNNILPRPLPTVTSLAPFAYETVRGGRRTRRRTGSKRRAKTAKVYDDDMYNVWGKNKPLEKFWRDLASGKRVVLIMKNGKHKYANLPSPKTKKYGALFEQWNADDSILSILSSNSSQDAYEEYLYPKAGDKTVSHVIKNYKKYFEKVKTSDPQFEKIMFP